MRRGAAASRRTPYANDFGPVGCFDQIYRETRAILATRNIRDFEARDFEARDFEARDFECDFEACNIPLIDPFAGSLRT